MDMVQAFGVNRVDRIEFNTLLTARSGMLDLAWMLTEEVCKYSVQYEAPPK